MQNFTIKKQYLLPAIAGLALLLGGGFFLNGEATEMDETMTSILQTLVLAVAFIFMILSAQFESFLEPLAIMAALALGPGAEARAPMAHAILGWLVSSTILTLVVIPCLYSLLHRRN